MTTAIKINRIVIDSQSFVKTDVTADRQQIAASLLITTNKSKINNDYKRIISYAHLDNQTAIGSWL